MNTQNFLPIPSLELSPETVLPFDLFVRLPFTNRLLLYRGQGTTLDQQKIEKVNTRRAGFFVPQAHYRNYLEYASKKLNEMIGMGPAGKAQQQDYAARLLSNIFSRDNAKEAELLLGSMSQLVTQYVMEVANEKASSRQALFKKFAEMAKTGSDFHQHPMHVASLTVILTLGLGLSDQKTLVEAGLAALMHDVGLTQLPMSVIEEAHKYRELGTVSKALLKMHPQGSLDVLRQRGVKVSKLMEAMIAQHHEEYSGTGFPQGLVGAAVHPMAQVLRVADELDELLSNLSAKDVIEEKVKKLFDRFRKDASVEPILLSKLESLLS